MDYCFQVDIFEIQEGLLSEKQTFNILTENLLQLWNFMSISNFVL